MKKPTIAITMGDPAGIGPEICLIALTNPDIYGACIPLVIGDAAILTRAAEEIGLEPPTRIIKEEEWAEARTTLDGPAVLDLANIDATHEVFQPGHINAETGSAAFAYVNKSIELALAGDIDGVTTAPINKEALQMAGVKYPGHTEIYADKTKAERHCMMLTSNTLTCSFVTVHTGYHEVPGLLSVERILDVIELTAAAMQRIRQMQPRLLVCGLNPHAGENGLFGQGEEEKFITPAIEQAREKGIEIEGPLPPDTVFIPKRREEADAVICMYHDQGHIPLKALAFDEAINVTLGLPIVRTSVDHGTALDIAWKGRANPNSLFEAILLAARMAQSEDGHDEPEPGL